MQLFRSFHSYLEDKLGSYRVFISHSFIARSLVCVIFNPCVNWRISLA
jgi:hypothetical protein